MRPVAYALFRPSVICFNATRAGEVVATGGGHQTSSLVRFFRHDTIIRAGETAEWTNDDSITPHTITFGAEPADPIPPSGNVTLDADGALHATITSPSDNVH